jgi:hypothetical protein
MAFWYPELKLGFQCRIPAEYEASPIFYWEAVAVACVMLCSFSNNLPQLVVFLDNQNTVDIWHSLKAVLPYNETPILAIDWLIQHETDACVLHIPGVNNIVTDVLSRFNNSLALCLVPGIKLGLFETPRAMLGALKK